MMLNLSTNHNAASQSRRRRQSLFVSAILLIAGSAAAQAATLDFNYLEAQYLVVDAHFDASDTGPGPGDSISLKSSDDDGFEVAGAWEFFNHFHVFGYYSKASNDLDGSVSIGGPATPFSGNFDVVRARGGIGYGWPLNDRWTMYSRLTYDYIELDSIQIAGVDVEHTDDDGLGFEAGLRWLPFPDIEVQGYARYSAVGDIDVEEGFDDDVLGGVAARWYVMKNLAIEASYEYGDIRSYGGGLRFAF